MIGVIGLGFVGLSTAVGFAIKGVRVKAFDIDPERSVLIRAGRTPFYEPGLEENLVAAVHGELTITESLAEAVAGCEAIFYCVGTPCGDGGQADLTYVKAALKDTLAHDDGVFKVLVIKSTVPPGTTETILRPFIEGLGYNVGEHIGLANNPEFLREGHAWEDFFNPDRVVIGTADPRSADILRRLYEPFGAPVHDVTLNTGEFIKYLSNTLLATLISYSNEMSQVAWTIGDIEIARAFKILHQDKRWFGAPAGMSSYAYPGAGFGGYCLPKDTEALYRASEAAGYRPELIGEVLKVNERTKQFVADRIGAAADGGCVGILGLSFKPGSDDVRQSPAVDIIRRLIDKGSGRILAYDPMAMDDFERMYDLPIDYASSAEQVLAEADTVALLTAWPEFRDNDLIRTDPKVMDFRYCLAGAHPQASPPRSAAFQAEELTGGVEETRTL